MGAEGGRQEPRSEGPRFTVVRSVESAVANSRRNFPLTAPASLRPEVDADAQDVIVGMEEAGGLFDGVVAECGRQ